MSNIPALPGDAVEKSLQRLQLDALEEIEACGSRLLRQAGHLNRLLALVPSQNGVACDGTAVERVLRELDGLLAEEDVAAQAACMDRLRELLGLTRPRTYAPMGQGRPETAG